MNAVLLTLIVSCVCGIVSAMGIGGGALLLIYMSIIASIPQLEAQYINLIYFIPLASMAVIWHIKGRYVDLKVGTATVIGGALGAFLGVRIAFSVDVELLHRLFGLLLLIIGIS